MNSAEKELSQTLSELKQTRQKLMHKCEENQMLKGELEKEKSFVQTMKLQFESSQTSASMLENENEELFKEIDRKNVDIDNFKKALGECQKMLYSSEADVDASIKSKEVLLRTFQVT